MPCYFAAVAVNMAKGALTVVIAVIGIAALLILILIPMSFSGVDYYEVR